MTDPSSPNYKPGVGSLVTDRFDFQDHVDGYSFRHIAKSIDLVPAITISTPQTNVHDAIVALKNALTIPLVPDATNVSKGLVQLAGDIAGSATSVAVVALRGFPVASTPPILNQVLTWTGASWQPQSVSGAFTFAGDVTGTAGATTVVKINGKPVTSTTPTVNDGLIWTGATWAPVHVIPTGTGFNTVSGGAIDAAGTANIRYASGKFQTDVNIQYKNSAITGDLAWAPTTSNKTLTLPNATDTLVGLATTDVLTNKTVNATNNTITDTSIALGDLFKGNGTKFVRFGRGTPLQVLRTNAGGTDLEWAAASGIGVSVAGTGLVTATSGTIDSNATQNVRYSSGKLQTDVNIQYNNAGITGDLAWTPTSSSKTLTLPNATDTLVGKATTDILTNKTISVNNNTLTATSQAAGDLLKNDGSSFVRFAKGSALQILRVNAGGTDLEWVADSGGGSSTGAVDTIQTSNGSGGFLGPTNMLAGASFISMGTTPASAGFLRFPYFATDTILATRDSGGTTREVISRNAANSIQFGPATFNALTTVITGNTVDIKPANQIRFFGTGGLVAMTVTGAGQTQMNPSNFEGLTINTNTNTTGAVAHIFGGCVGPGPGEVEYLGIGSSPTPPTGTPTGGGYLYVESGALKYRGTSGTLTTMGPAEPHCKKCGRDFMHEWQNDQYGKFASCMPCLLDALQSLGIDVDAFSERNLNS